MIKQPLNVGTVRRTLGLTQTQFAKLMAVSVRTLQDYEQGRRDINRASLAVQRNWRKIRDPENAEGLVVVKESVKEVKVKVVKEVEVTPVQDRSVKILNRLNVNHEVFYTRHAGGTIGKYERGNLTDGDVVFYDEMARISDEL